MKPTQEQVIAWYEQANGWSPEGWDKTVEELERFAALAYEAGRKDENEAIVQMIEDAPALVDFAKNEQGGCVMCGFTPKLGADAIRARMNSLQCMAEEANGEGL